MSQISTAHLLAALLAIGVAPAWGQPSGQTSPAAVQTSGGEAGVGPSRSFIDFGGRVGSVTGDPARWQRYRDLRDGPVISGFFFRVARHDWFLSAAGDHVGYRDQRYRLDAERPGLLRARFLWDQIPLFISQDTRTLYKSEDAGTLRIDDSIQAGIQEGRFTLRDVAPSAVGIITRTQRDNAAGELSYRFSESTDLHVTVTTSNREGRIPYGATFGFANAIEVAAPIRSRTTNVGSGVEWANDRGMLRVSWDGSWYENDVQTLVWDNPLRLTDAPTAPAAGRMALWPSNTYHTLSTAGTLSLPGRSRLVGTAGLGWARQNEPLLPHTINTALAAPPLPRTTAEAKGQTALTYLAFTSRPSRRLHVSARHRYYRFDNDTEPFRSAGFVNYDTSLRLGEIEPHFYSLSTHTLDVDVTTPLGRAAWRAGYGLQAGERTARHWRDTFEHTLRTSFDVTGQGPYSLRALYEHSRRHGSGLTLAPLQDAGEQITMRHYDIAERDRDRVSFVATAAPHATIDIIGSLAIGTDKYTEGGLGLRDNSHRVYSAGVSATPHPRITAGVSYSFEHYTALINQRQATSVQQAFDPALRWDVDTGDRAHNVIAHAELPDLAPRTEVHLSYDYSRARTTFLYSLPHGSTLASPEQLPPVAHTSHRLAAGGVHRLATRWSVALDYWYDRYDVEDFALGGEIDQGIAFPILEPGQTGPVNTVLLNYLYRPFRGHVASLRAVYEF
jgi:MtrB/PioB family decaheme-associated outer membrane protein